MIFLRYKRILPDPLDKAISGKKKRGSSPSLRAKMISRYFSAT